MTKPAVDYQVITQPTTHVPSGFYRSAICGGMLLRKRASALQSTIATIEKERTPAEHRAEVDAWRAKAAKHDHHIFGRKSKAQKSRSRHRDLAELGALMAFRSRPIGVAEGAAAEHVPTISTNWHIAPANDNQPPEEGFETERAVEYEPSLDLIENEIEGLPVIYRAEPMILDNGLTAGRTSKETHAIPVGGDIEYGTHTDDAGGRHQVIVRIGRLRFSDGSQTEKGHKLSIDGTVVDADIEMPVGAMLGSREKSARDKGSAEDTSGTNAHYRWMVKARISTPPKLHPKKGKRVEMYKAEARQILNEVMAITDVSITKCADGFPYGPTNLRQLFIGGRKGKKGESGSQAWVDIFTERENRETFQRGLDAMQDSHVRVLTEAMSAKSLGELGEARGYRGRHAIDAGRRLLRAANDNFNEAMALAKYAAEG
ncbi:hypothetical protein [Rhizobium phaseoli]|uniref:hypothetical protein n=1 Tax=Rhizobium phaseoli TaxID=396 RepID=UPI000BEA8FE0|nr:hypothetical protein [Rhizobium phaseoli]PDS68913.1 hypothetical protein CO651_26370 [Rhizobium phaseoli]